MDYVLFDLLVGQADANGYPVTVIESPAGEGGGALLLDPQDGELQDALALIESREVDADALAQIGDFLFTELFNGPVGALYRSSLAMARGNRSRLRLRLRLEAPEVAALPWEYLHDPDEDHFPALSPETALLRFIPLRLPARPTPVTPPLRLLAVISHPAGVVPLDVAREKAILHEALDEPIRNKRVELHILEEATVAAINQAMRTIQPHIFHFIGHGLFDGDRAFVVLEGEDGQAAPLDELTFREFFAGCKETRIAFLNACQSATTSSTRPLAGLAPNLLQRNLSAVVAMQYPITDRAALVFSREFYRELAAGRPVDVAVSAARKGVFMELGGDTPDWGIPVLFLRAKDGEIFAVEQPSRPAGPAIPPPPEPARPPAVENFIGRKAELAYYSGLLESRGMALVAGMPGVGKTALAVTLAQSLCPPEKLFWHVFHEGEGVASILWKLAAFLAWNGRPAIWEMVQGIALSGGDLPPPDVLLDYFLQTLRGQGYLLVLDNVQFVLDDPALERILSRLGEVVAAGELRLLLVSQQTPDFIPAGDVRPLTGLTRQESERLLALLLPTVDPEVAAELHRRTHGNAQLLHLAARAYENIRPDRLLDELLASQDVERFLLKQVDEHLEESEKEAMSGLAVLLGFPGSRDAIEEVLDGKNVRRQLTDLVNQHLLERLGQEGGQAYSQHAILQAFYYDLLSRRERRAMHRRAAQFYEFEEVDDLRAALHYRHAGDAAKAGALASRDVWPHIFQGQARSLWAILEDMEESHFDADLFLWVRVLLARGVVAGYLDRHDDAEIAYTDALAWLEKADDLPDRGLWQAQACRGMAYLLRSHAAAQALEWAEKGLAALGEGHPRQRADLLIQQAIAQRLSGQSEAALASLHAALEILPPGADYERMLALLNLGYLHFHGGRLGEAIQVSKEALALARKHHNRPNELVITSNLAAFQQLAGAWTQAAQGYAAAVEMARQIGYQVELARAELNRGVLALCQGEEEIARRALTFSLNDARQRGNLRTSATALLYLTKLHLQAERSSAAEPLLAEAQEFVEQGQMAYLRPMLHEVYAHFHLAAGNRADAESHIRRSLDEARRQKMSSEEGRALRLLAHLRALAGAEEEADELFAQSLARLEAEPYEAALTNKMWGEQLLEWGERMAGRQKLRAAQEVFERLGVKELAR